VEWKERIPACFGDADGLFAIHPLDEDRAFQLLGVLREKEVSWAQAKMAFLDFVQHSHYDNPEQIEKEMERIERHMRPWLR